MAIISNVIARGQLVPLHFMQADLAASQTDVQLSVAAVDNAADDQLQGIEYAMPFAGEVVAVSYTTSAAATTGTMTIGATFAGTEDTDTTITVTTGTSGYGIVPRGKATFAAGEKIGCEITTGGTWDGTTADLVATVWVLLYIAGI